MIMIYILSLKKDVVFVTIEERQLEVICCYIAKPYFWSPVGIKVSNY